MKKRLVMLVGGMLTLCGGYGQKLILPVPSAVPSKAQQQQIARRYGMFVHFGMGSGYSKLGSNQLLEIWRFVCVNN